MGSWVLANRFGMQKALNYTSEQLRFRGIVGTGGIGTGWFFRLNGNHTLGREESRSGRLLDMHDYCKQHIILHYIKVLLGSQFRVIPIGKVGKDDPGRILIREMENTGFVMDFVREDTESSTLFSFCFLYPDGSGGNLTTDNSASSRVSEDLIREAEAEIKQMGEKGIVMAAPEVPIKARKLLLETGQKCGAFCAASFTREEILNDQSLDMLRTIDLLALNREEASALCQKHPQETPPEKLIECCLNLLGNFNPNMYLSITCGSEGSYCWDGSKISFFPSCKVKVENTAGAGDAFFSGLLCGIALGCALSDAQQLATLIAGLSVTSKDTIHKGINRDSLSKFFLHTGISLSDTVQKLLND